LSSLFPSLSRPNGPAGLRIGLPRALYYYMWPELWRAFFRALGTEPVVSRRTSRTTVERASAISEPEHCLPNKVFDAHVAELAGCVDLLFVPRILSTLKGHLSCPKLGPLPDAARADIARNTPVLAVDIDERKQPLAKTLVTLGRKLAAPRREAKAAASAGMQALANWRERQRARRDAAGDGLRILVVGHPYVIHDSWFAGPVLRKLAQMDVTIELASFDAPEVPKSFIQWGICNRIYNQLSNLEPATCSGVVMLTTFQCGCDSMIMDPYREMTRSRGIPFMVLVIDEHTAAAGLDTRLEAFVDSLSWRA